MGLALGDSVENVVSAGSARNWLMRSQNPVDYVFQNE